MKKNYIKKICICSVLAALYVALELLSSSLGKIAFLDNYQLPISCFPLILASVMFGISWGTVTAVVGSFLSQLSFGLSWGTIIWMLPTIIYAYSVALLYLLFKKSNNQVLLGIQFFISSLILSVLNIIAMYVDSIVFGWPYDFVAGFFGVFVSLKVAGGLIFAVIFAIIVPPIIKSLKKIIKI